MDKKSEQGMDAAGPFFCACQERPSRLTSTIKEDRGAGQFKFPFVKTVKNKLVFPQFDGEGREVKAALHFGGKKKKRGDRIGKRTSNMTPE